MGSALSYLSGFLDSPSKESGAFAAFDLWVQLFTVLIPMAMAIGVFATEVFVDKVTVCLPPSNFTADSSAAFINAHCSTKDNNRDFPFIIYHEILPAILTIQALMAHQSLLYWHYRGLERMKADVHSITASCKSLYDCTLETWAALMKCLRARKQRGSKIKQSVMAMIEDVMEEEGGTLASKLDDLRIHLKTIQVVVDKYGGFLISKTHITMRQCLYSALILGILLQTAQIATCWLSGGILQAYFDCPFLQYDIPCAKHMEIVLEIMMCLNLLLCLLLPMVATLCHDHSVIWRRKRHIKYIYQIIPLIEKPPSFDENCLGSDLHFLSLYCGRSFHSMETLGTVMKKLHPCPTVIACPNFKEVLIHLLRDERETL
ncbi:uncharacterized protein [Ptychodera flava]|uniref:uncharacterized protein n=1 Tax=Ptychodera flava TaxID=63121 RepID=UPI00396A5C74